MAVLDGAPALLLLAVVVLGAALLDVDVVSVVLVTAVSDEVSVVMAVGSVVFVPAVTDVGAGMGVSAFSLVTVVLASVVVETVAVAVEDGEMVFVVVSGVADGRIVGAPVVVDAGTVVEVVDRPLGTGIGTCVESVAADSVDSEAMDAAAEERELAVEDMADATDADDAAMAAVSTDAEAVARGIITGERVTEPVDTDALAGIMIEVVYPLIAMGKTGPDGAGS